MYWTTFCDSHGKKRETWRRWIVRLAASQSLLRLPRWLCCAIAQKSQHKVAIVRKGNMTQVAVTEKSSDMHVWNRLWRCRKGTFDLGRELVNGHIQVNNNIWPDVWRITQSVQSIYTWFFKRTVNHIAKFSPKSYAVIHFLSLALWGQQACSASVDLYFSPWKYSTRYQLQRRYDLRKMIQMRMPEFENQSLCSMSLLDWCHN